VLDDSNRRLYFTNTVKLLSLRQPLRSQSRGSSFQHTAKFDRVPDVAHGELANPVATCTSRIKEAFVRKSAQGFTDRRARDAQTSDQLRFREMFAGWKLPFQDQFP